MKQDFKGTIKREEDMGGKEKKTWGERRGDWKKIERGMEKKIQDDKREK